MAQSSKAAYFVVDANKLHKEMREDALMGGSQFGVRVVEEAVNGIARQPVFGVYYNVLAKDGKTKLSNDEDKFVEACAEFGIELPTADEDAVRQEAEAAAAADAEAVRRQEEEAVRAVTGDTDADAAKKRADKGSKHQR